MQYVRNKLSEKKDKKTHLRWDLSLVFLFLHYFREFFLLLSRNFHLNEALKGSSTNLMNFVCSVVADVYFYFISFRFVLVILFFFFFSFLRQLRMWCDVSMLLPTAEPSIKWNRERVTLRYRYLSVCAECVCGCRASMWSLKFLFSFLSLPSFFLISFHNIYLVN